MLSIPAGDDGLSVWPFAVARTTTFSRTELRDLDTLRDRYRQTRDLFGAQEFGRLNFVRWLYGSGHLVP